MPTLTRVARLDEDGNDASFITVDLDGLNDDERAQIRELTDQDTEDRNPLDRYGAPREATYPAVPEVAGEPVDVYDEFTVPDLEAEVARRNADRDDDKQVAVEGKGTKADLVAALEADDKADSTTE